MVEARVKKSRKASDDCAGQRHRTAEPACATEATPCETPAWLPHSHHPEIAVHRHTSDEEEVGEFLPGRQRAAHLQPQILQHTTGRARHHSPHRPDKEDGNSETGS